VVLFALFRGFLTVYSFILCDTNVPCLKLNLLCSRGNQAFAEGQLTKAEECYTHGIDSFSPSGASRMALMLCYSNRAAARMPLGKMREALFDCREAIDIDPGFLKAQVRAAK
jgi:tetratricopeptide (TPR) repeat protein